MRTKALILLIPFVVFLTETASFIPAMAETCVIKAAEKKSCCKMKKNEGGQCQSKKTNGKEKPVKGCEEKTDCTTCPVCYLFIIQPQFEWQPTVFSSSKDYSLLTTSNTSSYTNDVWKPPNVFPGLT